MYSTVFILLLIAFYLLYNLSQRVPSKNKPARAIYFRERIILTRMLSLILILVTSVLLINRLGIGAGIFCAMLLLMVCASFVVVLSPLRYIRWHHLLAIYFFSIVLETFIF
jgi:hypothetical protein